MTAASQCGASRPHRANNIQRRFKAKTVTKDDVKEEMMETCDLQIEYPGRDCVLDQDEEWFHLVTEAGQKRIKVHEYDRVYNVPGLYEEVVYNKLQCDSPNVIANLLKETMAQHGDGDKALRVLDFGAGNGISGEALQEKIKTKALVGVDIIEAAKKAVGRDRPGLYDDYYVMDLSQLETEDKQTLEGWDFNALVTIAALGFGDIPTQAFVNSFNLMPDGSWVAFNIKDRFLSDSDETGYNEMMQEMIGSSLQVYRKHRYCHRLSMAGEPLHYYAIIGRKEENF
jgi:2-polyprenyl-3-methyl-5-hydroxy-6-metoxy-1,4-benzoquinol methylase